MSSPGLERQVLGHYRIIEPLGAGGMGEVYRARDVQLERDVAIKILPAQNVSDPSAKARLLREARTASQLNHPNICTIYEVGELDGQTFIAMELVAGESLSSRLRRGPLPSEQLIVSCGLQLADAVAHAHKNNVIHRDLKSSNVMLTPEDRIKVLDFGLAKRVTKADLEAVTVSKSSLTAPGAIFGTLSYMAPEQLCGQPADERSDIWATGVVLYEMGTAALPFRGATAFEISSAVLHQAPVPLPVAVPVALRAVIERCLEKDPARRYQEADELRDALQAIRTASVSAFGLVRYRLSHLRWQAAVGLVFLVSLLGGLLSPSIRTRLARGRQIHSLAVLPLENLSGDPQQEYFADGVHEALIDNLSKLSALNRVTARFSVMRYRKPEQPVRQIARELGVDAVITGSVQRAGDRVRVTARLINASNEQQLWREQYDRPIRDVLSLEDEIVGEITRQIKLQVTPEEKTRLTAVRHIEPEAYEAYLKGLSALHRRSPKDLEIALQYFQNAIEKDPNFAAPYAGIAQVWGHRVVLGLVKRSDVMDQDIIWARKALELDPNSSEAHQVWGLVSSVHVANWETADKEFRRAIELSPNDPDAHQYYSGFLEAQGQLSAAIAEAQKAVELDPLSPMTHGAYSQRLLVTHRYDEAIAECRKSLELNPSAPAPHHHLAVAYHMKGMDQQAFAEAKADFGEIRHDADVVAALDKGYAHGGFQAAMRQAAEVLAERSKQKFVPSSYIAELYAFAGDRSDALAWLRTSLDRQELAAAFLRLPTWDFVRSDPDFQEIFQKRMKPQ